MSSLDASEDRAHAVLAGEKVFRTIKVEGNLVEAGVDLLSGVSSQGTARRSSFTNRSKYDVIDVKWGRGGHSSTIIAAAKDGNITLYDLHRQGAELGHITNERRVFKIAINPHGAGGNYLLSAGQDGTVKLCDLRNMGQSKIFRGHSEAVRCVAWSPIDSMQFACCSDGGVVMTWDIRNTLQPLLKITAHESQAMSVAYHFDGINLASGGLDQECHVWDVSKDAKSNQKPKYTFTTHAPIGQLSWRPACWSPDARAYRAAQIATVYDDNNPRDYQEEKVQLWDIARSDLAFKEIFSESESAPTGLLWHDRDLIWTVDKDGNFRQTDVAFAPKIIDNMDLSSWDIGPGGELLAFMEQREENHRLRSFPTNPPVPVRSTGSHDQARGQSEASSRLGRVAYTLSRSHSEEDIVGSFMGNNAQPLVVDTSHDTSERRQTSSTSGVEKEPRTLTLDEALAVTGMYKSCQMGSVGGIYLMGIKAMDADMIQWTTNQYLRPLFKDVRERQNDDPTHPLVEQRFQDLVARFVSSMRKVDCYREAQKWVQFGEVFGNVLPRRAKYHCDQRMREAEHKDAGPARWDSEPANVTASNEPSHSDLKRHMAGETVPAVARVVMAEEFESTSNVTTPLARASLEVQRGTGHAKSYIIEDDVLELPPAASTTSSPSALDIAVENKSSPAAERHSSMEGYDFYGMGVATTPAIDISPMHRRQPLRLDLGNSQKANFSGYQNLRRHDSNESFQMFSSSNESQELMMSTSTESEIVAVNCQNSSDSQADSSWESSGPLNVSTSTADPRHRLPILRVQEASVPDAQLGGVDVNRAPTISSATDTIVVNDESSEEDKETIRILAFPGIIDDDYKARDDDPLFTAGPLDPIHLFGRELDFETMDGNPVMPALMVLVLAPLLPYKAVDARRAHAILEQLHHRLMSLRLFHEAALLRKLCTDYPRMVALGNSNVQLGFLCTTCNKPLDHDVNVLGSSSFCRRCKTESAPCPVCLHGDVQSMPAHIRPGDDDYIEDVPGGNMWFHCMGCNHGGHIQCMLWWHDGPDEAHAGDTRSDGCCPVEGCLHACMPGKHFDEMEADWDRRETRTRELQVGEPAGAAENR